MKTPTKIIFCVLIATAICSFSMATPLPELKAGMVINKSIKIKKGSYLLNAPDSLGLSVIRIEGNNITIDFNNAVLHGSNNTNQPNQFTGLAILVKGNNINIKNAIINGYKVAVMATGCKNLKIEHSNFSYNFRQHLQSTWQGEDLSDWMSYHHNEHDEWLRYGAGIYLKNCSKSVIQDNIITDGQCALMMVNCNDGMITNNNFSFNSGIGIGLYRSSRNNILHNQLDFNVRGYSHGFYNRGQDSAGILVFEQCNNNVFAYNSVTHGGDGFFLWAGQSTMEDGKGGCNDNYLFKNNFSYAPTNGVEVTFSKNSIEENIINECDHGVWGGYSWQTSIYGNQLHTNRIGIAIEHGQHINISGNSFENNKVAAVKLWARKTQPADWGYAQKRDTRSINYNFWNNTFKNENTAIDVTLTKDITLDHNQYLNTKTALKKDSSVENIITDPKEILDTTAVPVAILKTWKEKNIPLLPVAAGKEQIRITEWGPYNYRYPIIFLKKIDSNGVYYFDVLGPKGKWKIKSSLGVNNITETEGAFPAQITAKKNGEDVQLNMEFTGDAFADQLGAIHPAGQPQQFAFRDYKPAITWNVNWYQWDAAHDPNINYSSFSNLIHSALAVKTETAKQLNYTWWGEIGKQLPADSFATVATTTVNVKKGTYYIGVTADDLVKIFIDGKLVIDFWDAKKYVNDEDAHHSAIVQLDGKHDIRVEHVENSGYATLIFTLKTL
jgi:parallel beta-helix repeat protein